MPRERDYYDVMGSDENTGVTKDGWFVGVNAIVAVNEDPDHRHRIRVVIPSVDKDRIHEKWVDRLCWWSGSPGYGDFHIPEKGSEVLLFGRSTERHTLYYISRFNEDHPVPKDFWLPPHTRGFRTDGDYKSIVTLDHYMHAGRLRVETDASVQIIAPAGFFVNGRKF
jgi:hypothetical protein